jgi:hypothetical protein
VRQVRALSLASVCCATALLAPGAVKAITVGQVTNSLNEACDGRNNSLVQAKSAPGHRSFRIPRNGVITAWAHNSRGISGSKLKLKIFRPVRGRRFKMVGESAFGRFDDNGVITKRTRIRVRRGDVLGLGLAANAPSSPTSCFDPGGFRGDREYARAEDVRRGQVRGFPAGPFQVRLNVRARLEPDADRDGFGDRTQDRCPASARTQGPCAGASGLLGLLGAILPGA